MVTRYHPREWLIGADNSQIQDHMVPSEIGAYVLYSDYEKVRNRESPKMSTSERILSSMRESRDILVSNNFGTEATTLNNSIQELKEIFESLENAEDGDMLRTLGNYVAVRRMARNR